MSKVGLPAAADWGHASTEAVPDELVNELVQQSIQAIQKYSALPEGPEPCSERDGYSRASVTIPVTPELLDQLLNGATGYRAHYSVGIAAGEQFNRRLVEAVAPIVLEARDLYEDLFDHFFAQSSLLGPFSKFWYPKSLTDPSASSELLRFDEELKIPRWCEYWRSKPKPWKGLIAPVPEIPAVLLNGTFVNDAGESYDQKPYRSQQIYERGWT